MKSNIWQGKKVRLRAVEPDDWEAYWAWSQDSEADRHSYFIPFPPSKERMKQQLAELALKEPENDIYRFQIETLAGELVGTINTNNCEPHNGTFSYGLGINDAARRQGYASEAIKLLLSYYFFELRYQKVTVQVYSFNEPSIKLHQKLGFLQEGRLRRMIYTGGAYHDVFLFGLTIDEFASLHRG